MCAKLASGSSGGKQMFPSLVTVAGLALAGVLACADAALAQGQAKQLVRVHVYDGPKRPASQLATVFATRSINAGNIVYICEVNGKRLPGGWISSCPSVVYLLPGEHKLMISLWSGFRSGASTVTLKAVAGRTYQARATPTGPAQAVASVSEMPAGFRLTYKHLDPDFFATPNVQNAPVDPADAK
jgi:hypothetical protein